MRIFSTLLLICVLAGFLGACNDSQGQKIGVVDLNRLMRESVPGKAGLKFIEEQQTELQGRLDAIQDRLEKNPADEAAMQELQKTYAESQQRIQAEGQAVVTRLFDAIQEALNAWRSKNGYAILARVEALDSYDPALDVTNAVMADIDRLKIDFKPEAAPAPAEASKPASEPAEKPAKPAAEKPAPKPAAPAKK